MNKQELAAMVAEILGTLGPEPMVKGGDYRPANPGPEPKNSHFHDGDFVPDVTALDLRKLYLVEDAKDPEKFRRFLEEKTGREFRPPLSIFSFRLSSVFRRKK